MTDKQFNTLAQYEANLKTATTSSWARHPGRSAMQIIYNTLTEIAGPQPRLQTFCQPCVLRVLRNAGKLYFEEKARREAEILAKQVKPETASPKKVEEAPAPAPKKTTTKKATEDKPKTSKKSTKKVAS